MTCCCCTICHPVSAATVGLGCCRDVLTERPLPRTDASFTNTTNKTRWSLDLRYSDHDAPSNVGEDPESYTPEREPVTMACFPPEADFVVRDTRHPEREVRTHEEFQAIRSRWRGVHSPGRGWEPMPKL